MSAQIPDTLLVSEILKPTGFDCPEDLEGVSFNEAVSGGTSAELEDNKEVTITENGTIEITPTAGHDYAGMKKVTATVNVAGGGDIEANKEATIDVSTYTEPVEITPTAGKDGMAKATVTLSNIPSGANLEDNKEVEITENGEIEITPTEGKDGMKKVTATVNVPSVGGFAICLENGDSDGTIFSKVIAFGTAQSVGGTIPKGTYNAFFVTDDIVEGETHDFTDIPHLFQVPTNVSVTQSQWTPTRYTVTISEDVAPVNSGEYGTQGRRALLVLYPTNM